MSLSVADRILQTLRIQRGEVVLANAKSGKPGTARITDEYFELLASEYRSLLVVVAEHYGYESADMEMLLSVSQASSVESAAEIRSAIDQWRITAVVHGLDEKLPASIAMRCRIYYRQRVMGETCDENGDPYRADALEIR